MKKDQTKNGGHNERQYEAYPKAIHSFNPFHLIHQLQ
jgi:hypothetical protein